MLKGVDPDLERKASGALRNIVAGSNNFAPDADGIPALLVAEHPRRGIETFRRGLRVTDQPAGKSDPVWNASTFAAIS